jgi:ATP-binding cassette subfamily C (CFTR/MRP) protein 1
MQNTSWAADNQFGPAVNGTRSNFDFTLLFENTFLTIVPSTIFLFAALLRARSLYGSSKKVASSWTRLQKIVCLFST